MKIRVILIFFIACFSPLAAYPDECVQGDCANGTGTMIYSTGHKFTGGFKEGLRHGEGVMLMPGGRKIVGIWQDNEITEGTITYSDGRTYTGQWKFRERSGQGTLTWSDGRKYAGEFKNDQRHGKGTLIYPDGRQYVGDFQFGERTGQGTLILPDGTKRVGEFKNGEFVGK
jgi:hypothetical protein